MLIGNIKLIIKVFTGLNGENKARLLSKPLSAGCRWLSDRAASTPPGSLLLPSSVTQFPPWCKGSDNTISLNRNVAMIMEVT